jgi:hypothetical protein
MAKSTATEIPESAYQLGALLEDFRVSRVELAFNLICVPGLLGFIGAILYYRVPNLLAPKDVTELVWLVVGLAIILGGVGWSIWMIVQAYHNRHMRLLVFAEGFVCFRPDKVFSCRWDDVAWTREDIKQTPFAAVRELTLRSHAGHEWKLSKATDLVKDFYRLIDTIERKVAEVSLAACLDKLQAGKTLHFGVLKLNTDGVASGDRVLTWPEVASINEERGHRITIEKQGAWTTWAAVGINEILNKRLFLEIVERLGTSVTWDVAHA